MWLVDTVCDLNKQKIIKKRLKKLRVLSFVYIDALARVRQSSSTGALMKACDSRNYRDGHAGLVEPERTVLFEDRVPTQLSGHPDVFSITILMKFY